MADDVKEKDQTPPSPEEEVERLQKEVRRLNRQIINLQRLVDRNVIAAKAKSNVNAVIVAEKSRQEQYMNLLLENCPDIIILLDEGARFAYCTDAFLEQAHIANFGLINHQPYKKVFAQFASDAWIARIDAAFQRAMQEKQTVVIDETVDIGKDGNVRHYTISFTPMLAEEGNAGAAILVFHDMTDLVVAIEQADKAKEQAVQANSAKSDFLSNMSHEMRTPMNAIIGMTSIAKGTEDIRKKDYCLSKIDDASTHLLGVINDILDMSKIEANKFELAYESFVFEKMLINVTNVIGFRMDEKGLNFNVWVDHDIPHRMITDKQRLAQVITNLLANAAKFTPEGGDVTMAVTLEEDRESDCVIRFEVRDTGIGISKEQQKQLFHSFVQADSGISRRFGGTGLGLAISKNIVEMMDGRIWVESELGEGSRFIFTVRAKKDTKNEAKHPRLQVAGTLRVLVVDDSPEVLGYFQEISKTIGFSCDVALDGESAIRKIEQNKQAPYNIVFVDWKMPQMDGIEVTRKIKAKYGADVIVIMISAYEWNKVETEAKSAGVDRFLPKPLFASLIEECIHDCIGMENPEESHAFAMQDYEGRFEGVRILLAEDIEINREIVMELFKPTGAKIDCAQNGQIAFDMFAANPLAYDMIFMDIHMPEVDGYEATRMIRSLGIPKAVEVPIIAMTANVFREDVEKCMASGMNDHVGKPLDIEEVVRKMLTYL